MTTIVTRASKGSPLSWNEADANFNNLNNDKAENSAVALKAPIDNPTFTGTPSAPTATNGTNTTQIATTAFVQGKTATQTPCSAVGNISATDVQSAIQELDNEKANATTSGSKVNIKDSALANALEIDSSTKTINPISPYRMNTVKPAFSARLSANQSVTSGVLTKMNSDIEEFDTTNAFTVGRFVPQVAGIYCFSGVIRGGGTSISSVAISLQKNGADTQRGGVINVTAANNVLAVTGTWLVDMNGTTDYVELWGSVTATSPVFQASDSTNNCRFSGFLI